MIISTYLTEEEFEKITKEAENLAKITDSKTNVSAFLRKKLKELEVQDLDDLVLNIIKVKEADIHTFRITQNLMYKIESYAEAKSTTKTKLIRSILIGD